MADGIPTKEELEKLPIMAIAAFADICAEWSGSFVENARRAQPEGSISHLNFISETAGDARDFVADFYALPEEQAAEPRLRERDLCSDIYLARSMAESLEWLTVSEREPFISAMKAIEYAYRCACQIPKYMSPYGRSLASDYAAESARFVYGLNMETSLDLAEELAKDLEKVRFAWRDELGQDLGSPKSKVDIRLNPGNFLDYDLTVWK